MPAAATGVASVTARHWQVVTGLSISSPMSPCPQADWGRVATTEEASVREIQRGDALHTLRRIVRNQLRRSVELGLHAYVVGYSGETMAVSHSGGDNDRRRLRKSDVLSTRAAAEFGRGQFSVQFIR